MLSKFLSDEIYRENQYPSVLECQNCQVNCN
jgi:hypothetical protein